MAPAGFDVRPVVHQTVPTKAGRGAPIDHGAPAGSVQNPGGPIVRDSRTAVRREGFGTANPQPTGYGSSPVEGP